MYRGLSRLGLGATGWSGSFHRKPAKSPAISLWYFGSNVKTETPFTSPFAELPDLDGAPSLLFENPVVAGGPVCL